MLKSSGISRAALTLSTIAQECPINKILKQAERSRAETFTTSCVIKYLTIIMHVILKLKDKIHRNVAKPRYSENFRVS